MLCIGLFGTCGNSTWRKEFIEKYESEKMVYFNPQVPDWNEALAQVEAEHLVNDDIILFPVTDETYATGSLAETGFSIMQAINSNSHRSIVIMIDGGLKPELIEANPLAAKESTRARALVRAHLKKVNNPNVYIVSSFNEMLVVSLKLYRAHENIAEVRKLIS